MLWNYRHSILYPGINVCLPVCLLYESISKSMRSHIRCILCTQLTGKWKNEEQEEELVGHLILPKGQAREFQSICNSLFPGGFCLLLRLWKLARVTAFGDFIYTLLHRVSFSSIFPASHSSAASHLSSLSGGAWCPGQSAKPQCNLVFFQGHWPEETKTALIGFSWRGPASGCIVSFCV